MITLAMIVKNESEYLDECLKSAKEYVKDIVVVDTGSSDSTVRIAQAHGARTYLFPWLGDFAAARNFAQSKVKTPYTLMLDADERLDASTGYGIQEAVKGQGHGGYYLRIRNYMDSPNGVISGRKCVTHPKHGQAPTDHYVDVPSMRLFKSDAHFSGKVHETIDNIRDYAPLGVMIHHLGKLDKGREETKKGEYFKLALEESVDHPQSVSAWFNLAQQAMIIEDWRTTLVAATNYRNLGGAPSQIVLMAGAMALHQLGGFKESLAWTTELLGLFKDDAVGIELHRLNTWACQSVRNYSKKYQENSLMEAINSVRKKMV